MTPAGAGQVADNYRQSIRPIPAAWGSLRA